MRSPEIKWMGFDPWYLVWPASVSLVLAATWVFQAFGVGKFDVEGSLHALTGNFLIDAVIDLILTAPLLAAILLILFVAKRFAGIALGYGTAIVWFYFVLTVVLTLMACLRNFDAVRGAPGAAFLCSVSAACVCLCSQAKPPRAVSFWLVLTAPLMALITPLLMDLNDVSWQFFSD